MRNPARLTRAKSGSTRSATAAAKRRAKQAPDPSARYQRVRALLGEQRSAAPLATGVDAHALVAEGIPATAMIRLLDSIKTLDPGAVGAALGISPRTLARRKAAPRARLPIDESGRLWRFAELLEQATRVFGTQEEAEKWLGQPAVGLDGRKPIDLLRTPPGAALVADHLTRLEYGVYT